MGGFASVGQLGLICEGPVFFGHEESELEYPGVVGFFLERVSLDELHFGAVFDAKCMSEFMYFASAIPAIAWVVPIFESIAVLGSFGE